MVEEQRGGAHLPATETRSLPISTLLVLCLSILVVLAVAAVLAIGFSTGRQNTLGLLNDKSLMIVSLIEGAVRNHLDPALQKAQFIQRQAEAGTFDPTDRDELVPFLAGTLAVAPQITAVVFWDPDLRETLAILEEDGSVKIQRQHRSTDPAVLVLEPVVRKTDSPFWGALYYSQQTSTTFLNLIQPLWRDGTYLGFVAVVLSTRELSDFMSRVGERFDGTAYILYGDDRVLAHPNLVEGHPDLSQETPAVAIERVGDPVLSSLASGENAAGFEQAAANGVAVELINTPEFEYVGLSGRIDDYGEPAWVIGAYMPADQVNVETRRLMWSGFAGMGVLVLSIFAAVVLGRRLAEPIRNMAVSASQIVDLDLGAVKPLPGSRIRELQDQSNAFNRMLGTLRWFETYVPRALVKRLMVTGDGGAIASTERDLTILFTDIVGFTPLSETMPAGETASLLNDHFALLATCIDDEGGTIDKFIGDALMAFWGAPDPQADHAARACRAAAAIIRAVEADNTTRRANGLAPLRVRIGIHSGPVVVGNIGAPGRINFTIVGDTVNTAQRLEALAKDLDDGADVTVLVSAQTMEEVLPFGISADRAGTFEVKGKQELLEVFQLQEPASTAKGDAAS